MEKVDFLGSALCEHFAHVFFSDNNVNCFSGIASIIPTENIVMDTDLGKN